MRVRETYIRRERDIEEVRAIQTERGREIEIDRERERERQT